MAPVELSIERNIAIITINTPEKLGALDLNGYYLLGELLRTVALDDAVTITILTGSGRYFSAGADVTFTVANTSTPPPENPGRHWFREFGANNINLTRSFYTHPKILIAALNGPVVGLSAALIAFADFIYATPDTFLLTPFTTIGLVSEGGASYTFPRRMGYARANEALLLGKRHSSSDLVSCGFINQLFPKENFLEHIRNHVSDKFGDHLNHDSMLRIKKQICLADEHIFEAVNIREAVEGVQRFAEGIPQKAFAEIASGARKHKL